MGFKGLLHPNVLVSENRAFDPASSGAPTSGRWVYDLSGLVEVRINRSGHMVIKQKTREKLI